MLDPLFSWLKANPIAFTLLWPIFSALVTFVFASHTDEELASYPKWFALGLKFCASFGIDSRRLLETLRGKITGLVVVLVAGALAVTLSGCAAFTKVVPFLPTPAESECVLTDIDKGMPAMAIVLDCKLEQNALAFIESLMQGRHRQLARSAPDGGAK